MKNKDIIQRFLFDNMNVRGEIVHLSRSYQEITQQHDYPSSVRKILGEALAVVSLLSAIIKFKGRLSLQFRGNDALKLLLVQGTNEFQLRGLAQWQGDLSDADLLNAMTKGQLAVIVNSDSSTARYEGIVGWQGNSLAESIEGYFKNSEQLPTRIWLAVDEHSVAGLMLQPLPKENTLKSQAVTGDNDWEHLIHLTETITPEELLNLDNHTLLHRLYSQEEVRVFEPEAVEFRCTCSIERGVNAIQMLGEEEAEEELKDKQKIVVTCEFCNKEYVFDRVDVAKIFKDQGSSSSSNQVH